ncbi:proline racemase [Burkholderia sp. BT03]|nr:proline racemase [Burkholderia sp. BT03]
MGSLMIEPPGHEVIFGSIVSPPSRPAFNVAVIFSELIGCLSMCGQGMIGTVASASEQIRVTLVHISQPIRWVMDTRPTLSRQGELVAVESAVGAFRRAWVEPGCGSASPARGRKGALRRILDPRGGLGAALAPFLAGKHA